MDGVGGVVGAGRSCWRAGRGVWGAELFIAVNGYAIYKDCCEGYPENARIRGAFFSSSFFIFSLI